MKKFKSINVERGLVEAVYNISETNKKTTVDQDLTIKKEGEEWIATIAFENFPLQKTPTEAHKLADWMVRLGTAIQEDDYGFIDLIEL